MGNKAVKEDEHLGKWIEYLNKRNKEWKSSSQFQKYEPKSWINLAIQTIQDFRSKQMLQSYAEDIERLLKNSDPTKYVNQLAAQIILDQTPEYGMPETIDQKESTTFKIIARSELLKDILVQYAEIFHRKYQIFFQDELLQNEIQMEERQAQYISDSTKKDIKDIRSYLSNVILGIYNLNDGVALKSLIIRMVFSKQKVNTIIMKFYNLTFKNQVAQFKQALLKVQNLTLEKLELPGHLIVPYLRIIKLLNNILDSNNPGVKYDLFKDFDRELRKDLKFIKDLNLQDLSVDNTQKIVIYCVIQTQRSDWICQLKFLRDFIGNEISYEQGQQSVWFNKVESSIEYILNY